MKLEFNFWVIVLYPKSSENGFLNNASQKQVIFSSFFAKFLVFLMIIQSGAFMICVQKSSNIPKKVIMKKND